MRYLIIGLALVLSACASDPETCMAITHPEEGVSRIHIWNCDKPMSRGARFQ